MSTPRDNIASLNLALALLKNIPLRHQITSVQLRERLMQAGIERDLRSVQRQLDVLCQNFDIECDSRSKPYGYRWKENARGFSVPGLTEQESLLLMLAKEHLAHLLPTSLMKSMSGFFDQARRNLHDNPASGSHRPESRWLKKVRVVSNTVHMLPPKIAPGVFEELSSAVYKDEWLDISYRNAKGQTKQKQVMPLGIAQQGQRLFVPCIFKGFGDVRLIAVHRISQAKNTGLPFARPKDFDLEAYDDMGRFGYGNAENIDLKLWINDYLKLLLEETPLSKNQNIVPMPDGSAGWELSASVLKSMQLVWWLRSQGKAVRVFAPTALGEQL